MQRVLSLQGINKVYNKKKITDVGKKQLLFHIWKSYK